MIYLDNSATTNKKPFCVKYALFKALTKKYCANAGHSAHTPSINSAMEILSARKELANFFNLPHEENVIFTSGCTEALNLALLGTCKKGGHVITTTNEHNSVLRPLYHLQQEGLIEVTFLKVDNKTGITPKMLNKAIKPNTYMLAVNHISNVTGQEINIDICGQFAKKHNLLFLVDAAQSAGHKKIDMIKSNINFLAIAGHKGLYSLQGIGALLFKGVKLNPIKYGGTGIFSEKPLIKNISPEAYEAGTLPAPNIFALKAGVKFVKKHFNKLQKKCYKHSTFLINNLDKLKNITLYTHKKSCNGVVAFSVKNYSSQEVENILNSKFKICVRSGLHCAPLLHKKLGTNKEGLVRVSTSYYTKTRHLKKLIKALKTFN